MLTDTAFLWDAVADECQRIIDRIDAVDPDLAEPANFIGVVVSARLRGVALLKSQSSATE